MGRDRLIGIFHDWEILGLNPPSAIFILKSCNFAIPSLVSVDTLKESIRWYLWAWSGLNNHRMGPVVINVLVPGVPPEQPDEASAARTGTAGAAGEWKLSIAAFQLVRKRNFDRSNFETSAARSVFEQKFFGQIEAGRSPDPARALHGVRHRASDPGHLVDVVSSRYTSRTPTSRDQV